MAAPEKTTIDPGAIYSLTGAAKAMGLSNSTVRKCIKYKGLPASRPSERDYKIKGSDILKWLDDRQTRPTAIGSTATGTGGASPGKTDLVAEGAIGSAFREMQRCVKP